MVEQTRVRRLAVDERAQATRSVLSAIREASDMMNVSSDTNEKAVYRSVTDGLLADLKGMLTSYIRAPIHTTNEVGTYIVMSYCILHTGVFPACFQPPYVAHFVNTHLVGHASRLDHIYVHGILRHKRGGR